MSATQYASLVLRTPSKRALPTRFPSAGRLEALVLAAGICLPVPLLAATGLSVPLPNVVERIAAALVPWADPSAFDDEVATARKGTIVSTPGELTVFVPTRSTAPGAEAALAPKRTARTSSLLPRTPGAAPASAPARRPITTDSRPSATPSPTGAAEPERPSDAPAATPAGAEPAPAAPAQAPAPRATSEPAPTQATPAPTPTTPTSPTLQETVDTVTGVVADPVGTVEETIADPIGTVEETLPVLAPVTTPLKPLLPRLGGK